MFESHIEKDILIKSELVAQMFQGETIVISRVSQLFQLSSTTLIDYVEEICERLKPYIIDKNYYYGEYKITISTQFPVYVYQKVIFKNSKFLQGTLLYLQDRTHYLDFVGKLYISVGSSYNLKQKVEEAFKQLLLTFEEMNELEYRLLCMNLSLKVTPVFSMKKNRGFQKCLNYFFTFIQDKGFLLTPENKYYVAMGFLIAHKRSAYTIHYTKERKKMLEQLAMFQQMNEFYRVSDLKSYLAEEEIYFLTTILNSCHYTFATIDIFNQHYAQLNELFLYKQLNSVELLNQFSEQFSTNVQENHFFVNAVTKLLKTAHQNEQLFFPSQCICLTEKENAIYQEIRQMIILFSKNTRTPCLFNENYIKRFTKEVVFLLDQDKKVTSVFVILTNRVYNSLIMSIFQEKKDYLNIPTHLFNSYIELKQMDAQTLEKAIIFYDDVLDAPTIPVKAAIPINVKTICGRFS